MPGKREFFSGGKINSGTSSGVTEWPWSMCLVSSVSEKDELTF